MRLEFHATPEEVMRAVEALQAFGEQQGLPEKVIFNLSLALEESGSNIVNHALQRDPRQTFYVTIERNGPAVVLTLRDRGPKFDPTQTVPTEKTDDDPPGGWGIQLVRRAVDEVRYYRQRGQNVLRLTKKISRANKKHNKR